MRPDGAFCTSRGEVRMSRGVWVRGGVWVIRVKKGTDKWSIQRELTLAIFVINAFPYVVHA